MVLGPHKPSREGRFDSRYPASLTLAGKTIDTTVDSRIAEYYAARYLANERTDPALDSIIDDVQRRADGSALEREHLRHLSNELSPDFAALYLVKRSLEGDTAGRMQLAFGDEFRRLKEAVRSGHHDSAAEFSSFIILFAPGWRYRSHPETGADFARPRQVLTEMGFQTYLIESNDDSSVESNADIIAREIVRYSKLGKNIMLASSSKAGAEVATALGERLDAEQSRSVRVWVNISGILKGTPLADPALHWFTRWFVRLSCLFRRVNFESVMSLTTPRGEDRFRRLRIPKHITVVNYIGVPLSGGITERARRGYRKLRHVGPTDGLTLLLD